MEIEIDICKCLLRNNFLQGEANLNLQLKSALCFRLLLFFDSLHDFGDETRSQAAKKTVQANDNNLFGKAYVQRRDKEYLGIDGDKLRSPDLTTRLKEIEDADAEVQNWETSGATSTTKKEYDAKLKELKSAAETKYKRFGMAAAQLLDKRDILNKLFYKLLEDLVWIFNQFPTPESQVSGSNLNVLKQIINIMFAHVRSGEEALLTINSIFYSTARNQKEGDILTFLKGIKKLPSKCPAVAAGKNFDPNKFFLFELKNAHVEQCSDFEQPSTTNLGKSTIYLYPSFFLSLWPELDLGGLENLPSMGAEQREAFKQFKNKGPGITEKKPAEGFNSFFTTEKKLRASSVTAVDILLEYIYNVFKDIPNSQDYAIYILVSLLYCWENRGAINVDSKDSNPIHIFYFKYILQYSLNCHQYIPVEELASADDIFTDQINYTNLIIRYLCYQDPFLGSDACDGIFQEKIQEQVEKAKLNPPEAFPINLNNFFQKNVLLVVDADGKPRSINYLTKLFMEIYTNMATGGDGGGLFLCKTLGSEFDAATTSQSEAIINKIFKVAAKQCKQQWNTDYDELESLQKPGLQILPSTDLLNNKPLTFLIKSGEVNLMKIRFFKKDKHPFISFEQFFRDALPVGSEAREIEGGLKASVTQCLFNFSFNANNASKVYNCIAKTMGDFSQMLYYYVVRLACLPPEIREQFFSPQWWALNNLALNELFENQLKYLVQYLGIYHTLDTWAASMASLFVLGVICEQGIAGIQVNEENLELQKWANNKMFVPEQIKTLLTQSSKPPADRIWTYQNQTPENIKRVFAMMHESEQSKSFVSQVQLHEYILKNVNSVGARLIFQILDDSDFAVELLGLIEFALGMIEQYANLHADVKAMANAEPGGVKEGSLVQKIISKQENLLQEWEGKHSVLLALQEQIKPISDATDQGIQAITNLDEDTGHTGEPGSGGAIWKKGGGYTRSGKYYGILMPDTDPFAIVATDAVVPTAYGEIPLMQTKNSFDHSEAQLQQVSQIAIHLAEEIKQGIEISKHYYMQLADAAPAYPGWTNIVNKLDEQLNEINSSINTVQNTSEELNEKKQTESEIDAVEQENTIAKRVKQRRNPREAAMDKDELRTRRQQATTKTTRKKKNEMLMKRRGSAMQNMPPAGQEMTAAVPPGIQHGHPFTFQVAGRRKLTVKANKKKLFKKTKKKLKKGKPRKHYKTRKHYKSKKQENIEKILKNLKI